MRDILSSLHEKLVGDAAFKTERFFFNFHDVRTAVSRLKAHKNDSSSELSSDHIINAGNDWFTHVACLLTAMAVHGAVPEGFWLSKILPIPKGRNANTSDSVNFRGIASSSIYVGSAFSDTA